jgi:hypothetical protein
MVRRVLLSFSIVGTLWCASTISPAVAKEINVLVTSDFGAAQIRNTLTTNRCSKEEDILRQHPFLLGQKMFALSSGDPNQCLGAATAIDHAVSVAGALAGGDFISGRFTILPGPFVKHAKTRLGGYTTALFPYIPVAPEESNGSPMVWLMPVEVDRSKEDKKTIKQMMDNNWGAKIQHKKRLGVVFVAAPTEKLCNDNSSDINWQVRGDTTECKCYPSCLGRVDAANRSCAAYARWKPYGEVDGRRAIFDRPRKCSRCGARAGCHYSVVQWRQTHPEVS